MSYQEESRHSNSKRAITEQAGVSTFTPVKEHEDRESCASIDLTMRQRLILDASNAPLVQTAPTYRKF